MKVALVLDRFDPELGGLERWTNQLAQWLVAHGHEVHVAATLFAEQHLSPGITPHRFAGSPSRAAVAAAAEQCLRSFSVDVIHDTGTGWYFDVFQPQAGSRIADWRQNQRAEPWHRRPLVLLSPRRRLAYLRRRSVEKRQLRSRRGVIIAASQMLAAELQTLHGVDPQRIRVIYNGVDVEHFTPQRRATDGIKIRCQLGLGDGVLFLMAANNLKLKGAATALAAFARIAPHAPDASLVVISRHDASTYQRRAAALGIADRCRFLGFVSDCAPYYSAADVCLLPTFYDTCSLTVLEGWASGIPAITTRSNGAAELMIPGQHGFVVERPGDVEALSKAMLSLLDPARRAAMAEPCRALAVAHSTAVNFQNILAVYESVVQDRRRAAGTSTQAADIRG